MNSISKKLLLSTASAFIIAAAFTSCGKDSNNTTTTVTPPTPIGGYNNSNEVSASTLKAHWTFDGTNNEGMSGTAPTTVSRASFGTGIKGQGLVLDSGFVAYPTIANLNITNVGSMTVSCWIKTDNNGSKATNAMSITRSPAVTTDWNQGLVNMLVETGHGVATDDTLVLHPSFSTYVTGTVSVQDNINDYGVRETDFKTVHGTNKWVHYVFRYNASGSFADIFANGILVSNNNFRHRTVGGVDLGGIVAQIPAQVVVGGFANAQTGYPNSAIQGFQGLWRGSIDEIRFYNSALSDADISALYQLELAGR